MKRAITLAAVGMSALFLLAACKEDKPENNTTDNTTSTVASPVKQDFFLDMTFNITAEIATEAPSDDRALQVSLIGYCEDHDDLDKEAYITACTQTIKEKLEKAARSYPCFEGALPAISAEVRNHADLPKNSDDFCYDTYPENYASYTKEMMQRSLELTKHDHNLYTVTKIEAVQPG